MRELFRTNFEGDVRVDPPFVKDGQWWSKITGNDWPKLPGEEKGFQPMVGLTTMPQPFVQDLVTLTTGRDHLTTRALFQLVTGDDPEFQGLSRSNYLFKPGPEMSKAYQSMRLFLQHDLESAMMSNAKDGKYSWRQVWEVKMEPDEDGVTSFRSNVSIVWTPERGLHWRTEGQYRPVNGIGEREWYVKDSSIEVPTGRWFDFGVYLDQHASDGRFIATIDGKVLVNHRGPTMIAGLKADKWNLVKLYTDSARITTRPHWQFVDDLLILGSVL